MTNRQVISDIRSLNKLLSSDNLLNDRSILQELNSTAAMLIKREANLRRLWQSPNIFTHIPCLEMEEVPLAECCEYTSERTIARSKQKIPKMGESIFGLLVQQIASVDGMVKFAESTPMRYANLLKIQPKITNNYFWIFNSYLYITNPKTKLARVSAYFEEDVDSSLLFPADCDCKAPTDDECISTLDKDFKCPTHLVDNVKSMVHEKLLRIYQQVAVDRTSDNNDETSR